MRVFNRPLRGLLVIGTFMWIAGVPVDAQTLAKKPAPKRGEPAAAARKAGAEPVIGRGLTRQATRLLASAQDDAAPVGELAANAVLDVIERKAGWVRVRSAVGEGWMSSFDMRLEPLPVTMPGKSGNLASRAPKIGSGLMGVKGTDAGATLDLSQPPDLKAYEQLRQPVP